MSWRRGSVIALAIVVTSVSVLAGVSANASVTVVNSVLAGTPYAVAIAGRYAYTVNQTGNSVSRIDLVTGQAITPFANLAGTSPSDIAISGNYAYTANYGSGTVSRIDLTNLDPNTNSITFATPSATPQPAAIAILGSYAYVADGGGAYTISRIDLAVTGGSPTLVATLSSTGGQLSDLAAAGNALYAVRLNGSDIARINLANSPATVTDPLNTTSLGTEARTLAIAGGYAYTANFGSQNISRIDLSNGTTQQAWGTLPSGAAASGIAISGGYVYTSNYIGGNAVSQVSLATGGAPVSTTPVPNSHTPFAIAAVNGVVVTANLNSNSASVFGGYPVPSLAPTAQNLPGTVGQALNSTPVTPSNFWNAVSYTVSPALPAPLQLNSTTGVISGTPNATLPATTFTITAADGIDTATSTLTLTVAAVSPPAPSGASSGLAASGASATMPAAAAVAATLAGLLLLAAAAKARRRASR